MYKIKTWNHFSPFEMALNCSHQLIASGTVLDLHFDAFDQLTVSGQTFVQALIKKETDGTLASMLAFLYGVRCTFLVDFCGVNGKTTS